MTTALEITEAIELQRAHFPNVNDVTLRRRAEELRSRQYKEGRWPDFAAEAAEQAAAEAAEKTAAEGRDRRLLKRRRGSSREPPRATIITMPRCVMPRLGICKL
jgi:hypothetical protein